MSAGIGLLLDIDDTLVDTRGAFRDALAQIALTHLRDAPEADALTEFWRADANGWYRSYTRGEMGHREQRMRRANDLHAAFGGAPLDDAGYDAWDADFERAFRAAWRAFPDAAGLLDALDAAGVAYGAVSNAAFEYQVGKLAAVGLSRVRMLVGVDTFGVGKPDARVFHEGARLLGVDVAAAAYLGDEPDIDALAAADAGLAGIWLDRPGTRRGPVEQWRDGARLARVESLADVPEALETLLR